ncbi:MAG: trypsin-like serine protease [Planctomycetota bacterium]|nr:MAG: trypsin-like serine protease [Planctomycetota bacterium]
MKNRAFCQRNLKAFFGLLILLIAATIVWAIVFEENRNRAGHNADITHSKGSPEPTAGAGRSPGEANHTVDAVTMATPNKGINLIRRPGAFPPSVRFGAPDTQARMQLVATRSGSRHAFNTVSALILPAVVNIHAARDQAGNETPRAGGGARFADPFDGIPEKFVRNKAYESVGSGFIIDSRGYILTNYHVISQASDLLVSVSGKLERDFPGTAVAVDPAADLALIKVSGAPALPEAKLGDSHTARVGDWVLAFGSPFGLEQTVTQGIVSNKRKSLVVGGVSYGEMLQTDAPINRGSSGGPLVNLKAEVIGINTAIYGPDGAFSGTGFAIPADRARAFLARFSHVFDR